MTNKPKKPAPRDMLEWMGINDAPNWSAARALGPLLTVILMFLMVGAITAGFAVLIRTITGQIQTSLGSGALITAILGAPFLIWGTIIRHRALGFQKEGHLTDRISKAVEQLGAEKTVKIPGENITLEQSRPNIEVRIGAILSLERIAQDSVSYDKGRDHVRVMEILTAYIRENAPASEAEKPDPDMDSRALSKWVETLKTPRQDIAIALQVIGRRDPDQLLIEARWGAAAEPDADWVFDTPLPEWPKDGDPQAKQDYFQNLDAWKTKIDSYKGYRPDLRLTNLQKADLSNLTLSGALLGGVQMQGAHLMNAQLQGTKLMHVQMQGANLIGAQMQGASLTQAQMQGADLIHTQIQGAYLRGVQMDAATNLSSTDLTATQLTVTDLSNVDISAKQITSAFGDASVILPEGIPRPAHWPDWELSVSLSTEWHKWRDDPDAYTPPPKPEE